MLSKLTFWQGAITLVSGHTGEEGFSRIFVFMRKKFKTDEKAPSKK